MGKAQRPFCCKIVLCPCARCSRLWNLDQSCLMTRFLHCFGLASLGVTSQCVSQVISVYYFPKLILFCSSRSTWLAIDASEHVMGNQSVRRREGKACGPFTTNQRRLNISFLNFCVSRSVGRKFDFSKVLDLSRCCNLSCSFETCHGDHRGHAKQCPRCYTNLLVDFIAVHTQQLSYALHQTNNHKCVSG